jgi:type IV secretion system protein VirD4
LATPGSSCSAGRSTIRRPTSDSGSPTTLKADGGIAAIVVAVTISVWRAREAKRVATYGSARWAETREAGLLGHDGVLLGRWQSEYLRHDGEEHVLCFAPTRSSKHVGLVVPTLLTWPGSAIVLTSRARTGR